VARLLLKSDISENMLSDLDCHVVRGGLFELKSDISENMLSDRVTPTFHDLLGQAPGEDQDSLQYSQKLVDRSTITEDSEKPFKETKFVHTIFKGYLRQITPLEVIRNPLLSMRKSYTSKRTS
jgi:hypothetical protein